MKKRFLLFSFFALMLSLQENSFAQRKLNPKDALVFEISKISNPGGYRGNLTSSNTFYFYDNGRIACKSTSYDPRGKEFKSVKSKCIQLTKAKINELIELAERTDFLEAKDNYSFFGGGVDYGKSLSIIFYRKVGEKKIHLTNPRQSENNIALPESVTEFLTKIAEIDNSLEVKREIETEGK